jgi:hypothetical protein
VLILARNLARFNPLVVWRSEHPKDLDLTLSYGLASPQLVRFSDVSYAPLGEDSGRGWGSGNASAATHMHAKSPALGGALRASLLGFAVRAASATRALALYLDAFTSRGKTVPVTFEELL